MLVTSPEAIEEFLDVVSRPRHAPLLESGDAAAIADLLRRAELHSPPTIAQVCRDPDDDFLLALALTSQVDVLVSRDEDLLAMGSYGQTNIIHVAEFLKRLHEAQQ
jgi:putative PIN family toxin of toxin-antitoxin system